MLSFKQISSLNESDVYSVLDKYGSDNMISAIIKEYPDYYNLRGDNIRNISGSESNEVLKILKKEL